MTQPVPATLVLGLGTVLSHGFGLSLVPAMLPRIADDLAAGYGVLGGVTAAGLVAYSVGAVAAARIVELIPGRALLIGTFAISAGGLAAAGAAASPAMLLVAVLILGLAAPLSWSVTLQVAAATVPVTSRAAVMAGAASGAAVGVLVNGALIQTSADLHSWRVSFVIAAVFAILPIAGALAVFRAPVPPAARDRRAAAGFRTVAGSPAGRLVVGAAVVAGAVGFPFSVFLTATALDEMRVSAFSAALLWWLIGLVGTAAGPLVGRYGDRASPLRALTAAAVAFAVGLAMLTVSWTYAGLLVAAVGLALLYYPIWGLVGAVASRIFAPAVALRAISLGLIGAAFVGAVLNAAAGAWIDATGSFRIPVGVFAVVMAATSAWHVAVIRRGGLESPDATAPA